LDRIEGVMLAGRIIQKVNLFFGQVCCSALHADVLDVEVLSPLIGVPGQRVGQVGKRLWSLLLKFEEAQPAVSAQVGRLWFGASPVGVISHRLVQEIKQAGLRDPRLGAQVLAERVHKEEQAKVTPGEHCRKELKDNSGAEFLYLLGPGKPHGSAVPEHVVHLAEQAFLDQRPGHVVARLQAVETPKRVN